MAKYLDTGAGDSSHSLGHWLDTNVVSSIVEFRAQFAYFTDSALRPYASVLNTVALNGCPVHFVIGSNEKSLVVDDVRAALKIVENAPNASVTVIAYSNAKFHPKTVHIMRSDNSAVTVVGSGNFTYPGLGLNVEAAIVLDTADGDSATVIQEVAEAIDHWRSMRESGVFPIHSEMDIQTLLSAGIISSSPPPRQPSAPSTASGNAPTAKILGSRQRLWVPPRSPAITTFSSIPVPTVVTAIAISSTVTLTPPQKWYKLMKASDAQQNTGHKIAQLRLTKSVFAIDFRRFFRYDLFGSLNWITGMKNIHLYEFAEVPFDIQFPGKPMGVHNLKLHYAPHQEQSQNNYTSILYWDDALKNELSTTSYIGYWVVIERNTQGAFSLTIQATRP